MSTIEKAVVKLDDHCASVAEATKERTETVATEVMDLCDQRLSLTGSLGFPTGTSEQTGNDQTNAAVADEDTRQERAITTASDMMDLTAAAAASTPSGRQVRLATDVSEKTYDSGGTGRTS